MASKIYKIRKEPLFRHLLFTFVAIVAVALLPSKPVFSFQSDKGIIYERSFSMDRHQFVVTQTDLATGAEHVTDTMSVNGLYYCYLGMLFGSIVCLFGFFSRKGIKICHFVIAVAGVYYGLAIFYALRMTDLHYATLFPTITIILPAIVIQMMLLARRNILRAPRNEKEEGN